MENCFLSNFFFRHVDWNSSISGDYLFATTPKIFPSKSEKRQKTTKNIFTKENFSSLWFSGYKKCSFDNSARIIPLESWIYQFNFRKKIIFFVKFTIFPPNASVGGTRQFLQQRQKHLARVRWELKIRVN